MFGNLGTTEVLVILVVALLLFGKRLPEVGRSLGRALMEFKRGLRGIEDQIKGEIWTEDDGRPMAAPPGLRRPLPSGAANPVPPPVPPPASQPASQPQPPPDAAPAAPPPPPQKDVPA